MNVPRLEYLIALSIDKKATAEELREMAQLIALPEHETLAKELLFKAYEMPKELSDIDPQKKDAILQAIYNSEKPSRRVFKDSSDRPYIKWLSIAATVLILFSASFFFIYHKNELPQQTTKLIKQTIVPGGNRAMLTLADGTKVTLDDTDTGKIANQGAVRITKTANGRLEYNITNSSVKLNANKFNMIETPKGGKYQISLPDGTVVWLNSASTLKYPVDFKGKERKVELSGEAYFEVSSNKKMPFRVISGSQVIEVLGTHFNVNSYKDDNNWETTLLEGSVRVSNLKNQSILKPGQQARIEKNEIISISEADIEEVMAWKNGYFKFHKEDIETIMKKVSRWYDVNVEFKGPISQEKFSGTISMTKNINQILEILEITDAVHFKIEGRRITVMK
ncbi:FecR family protein [Pedobacter nyackensis]|uniref:FecR family protein n=1 Tax=Pedobacter nyackensis TaxID=475255 RepID=UPI00292D84C4|nr:FecR family protein [Pedobacter nyackensis]